MQATEVKCIFTSAGLPGKNLGSWTAWPGDIGSPSLASLLWAALLPWKSEDPTPLDSPMLTLTTVQEGMLCGATGRYQRHGLIANHLLTRLAMSQCLISRKGSLPVVWILCHSQEP